MVPFWSYGHSYAIQAVPNQSRPILVAGRMEARQKFTLTRKKLGPGAGKLSR